MQLLHVSVRELCTLILQHDNTTWKSVGFLGKIFRGGQSNVSRNRGGSWVGAKASQVKIGQSSGGAKPFSGGGGGVKCPPLNLIKNLEMNITQYLYMSWVEVPAHTFSDCQSGMLLCKMLAKVGTCTSCLSG